MLDDIKITLSSFLFLREVLVGFSIFFPLFLLVRGVTSTSSFLKNVQNSAIEWVNSDALMSS